MAKKQWNNELRAKIIARAWKDENFRKQLIDNPMKTLEAMGIELPAGIDFKVMCDDSTHRHFILPQAPTEARKLSERELTKLAAAAFGCRESTLSEFCTVR